MSRKKMKKISFNYEVKMHWRPRLFNCLILVQYRIKKCLDNATRADIGCWHQIVPNKKMEE